MSMRIIGLDVGDRRIGIAVSDALGWTAQGLPTLSRTRTEDDVAAILKIAGEYDAARAVVGLPRNMDGSEGEQAVKTRDFGRLLIREGLDVVYWDERLTTRSAERLLIEGGVRRKGRVGAKDRVAAALILQGYLDAQGSTRA